MANLRGFQLIVANPKLIGELCELLGGDMPNIEMGTAGGKVWWNNLVEHNGWRLQKNKLTGHCRILDPSNNRKAWGSEDKMLDAINRVMNKFNTEDNQKNNYTQESTANKESKEELLNTLEKLGELKEKGLITEQEFFEKKSKIMSQI